MKLLHQPVIQGQGTDDRLIPFTAFLELLDIETPILILVHHSKDLFDAFLWRVFVFRQLNHRPDLYRGGLAIKHHSNIPTKEDSYHLVNGLDDA